MSQSDHLSDGQIASYRFGTLAAKDIIKVRQHLVVCPACANRVDALAIAGLYDDNDHLTYDEVNSVVENRTGPEGQNHIELHLAGCEFCKLQVDDLRKFTQALQSLPLSQASPKKTAISPESFRERIRRWTEVPLLRVSVGVAAVVVIGLVLTLRVATHSKIGHGQEHSIVETASGSRQPASNSSLPVTAKDANDVGIVTIDEVPQFVQNGVVALWTPVSCGNGFLDQSVDRGGALTAPQLKFPVDQVVQSLRPTFIWTPINGADRYRILIYGSHDVLIRDPNVVDSKWTPSSPLPAGENLSWRVTVYIGTSNASSPPPETPAEPFRTLSTAEQKTLAAAQKSLSGKPLALALTYARLGLYDNAISSIHSYLKEHPDQSGAKKMVERLMQLASQGLTS